MKTVDAAACEPVPPLADCVVVTAKLGCDLFARTPLGGRQHDPAAKRQRLRALRPPSPPLQHLPLLGGQHDLNTNSHNAPNRRR